MIIIKHRMKTTLFLIALLFVGSASAQQVSDKQTQSPAKTTTQADKYALVKRSKTAGITFIKDQIYQDDKIIGGVQMSQGTEKGQMVKTFSVFLPNGVKIAEAKCYGINSHAWTVVTTKDKIIHTLKSANNSDIDDILGYLIKGDYL